MSTKKTTTNSYDPGSMANYQSLNQTGSNALLQNINNPTGNMAFQQQQQMQNLQNSNQYGQAQQALAQRSQAQGMNPSSPMMAQQQTQLANQNSASGAQGYNSLLLNASNMRQSSINSAMSNTPLQTGQTQTSSGLGTWLPQVAGAALGAAAGVATGGATTAMGSMSNLGSTFGANTSTSTSTAAAPSYYSAPDEAMSGGNMTGNNLPGGTGNNAFLQPSGNTY